MLTFLYLAAKAGYVVDAYDDLAIGTMASALWVLTMPADPHRPGVD